MPSLCLLNIPLAQILFFATQLNTISLYLPHFPTLFTSLFISLSLPLSLLWSSLFSLLHLLLLIPSLSFFYCIYLYPLSRHRLTFFSLSPLFISISLSHPITISLSILLFSPFLSLTLSLSLSDFIYQINAMVFSTFILTFSFPFIAFGFFEKKRRKKILQALHFYLHLSDLFLFSS